MRATALALLLLAGCSSMQHVEPLPGLRGSVLVARAGVPQLDPAEVACVARGFAELWPSDELDRLTIVAVTEPQLRQAIRYSGPLTLRGATVTGHLVYLVPDSEGRIVGDSLVHELVHVWMMRTRRGSGAGHVTSTGWQPEYEARIDTITEHLRPCRGTR